MNRLDAYWMLRSLPTHRLDRVLELLNRARGGGVFARGVAAVQVAVEACELLLVPRHVTEHLQRDGYVRSHPQLFEWLKGIAKSAPDLNETGRSRSDGSLHVWRSASRGLVLFQDSGLCGGECWVRPGKFASWAAGDLWRTGLLDIAIRRDESGGMVPDWAASVTMVDPPPVPVQTASPSPAALAESLRSADQRVRVALLVGPSGCGKSITACSMAAELGLSRTMRVLHSGADMAPILSLVQLLRPTCLVFDDLPMADTTLAMAMLDELRTHARDLVIVLTLMYEGRPEDLRLPGLRAERVDVLAFFRSPDRADRLRVLLSCGLNARLAAQVADHPAVEGWSCAYLVAAARRLQREPGAVAVVLETLELQRRIAAHDAPALVSSAL